MISGVTFDADQTLWDFDAVMRRSLAIALDRLRARRPGPSTSAMTVDQLISIRADVAAELEGKAILVAIRRAAFERTVELSGEPDQALTRELTDLFLHHRFHDIELYPDVIPALDALGGHYRLGLITNGNTDPERCGLSGRFDFTVFGEDHGTSKPDPRLFAIAAEAAGLEPDQLVHVGDSLDDVDGAKSAGWRAVLLNRSGRIHPAAAVADFEIASLTQLPDVLVASES